MFKIDKTYKAVCISIIIAITMFYGSVQLVYYISNRTDVSVTGKVYGKYVSQEHHKYHTDDIFNMAVHPYDKKYRDYSVVVDYATFAKFKEGDNITFKMSIFEVTDAEKYQGWYNIGMFTLLAILFVLGAFYAPYHFQFWMNTNVKKIDELDEMLRRKIRKNELN